MRRHRVALLVVLGALSVAVGCSTGSGPNADGASSARPTYRNPVFRHDAPDPSVIEADGVYYAYTTQSIYLDLIHLPILRSTDLVHWTRVGDALPDIPRWVVGGPAGDMWAPHVLHHGGRYLLYYAGRRYGVGDMAIGAAWAKQPTGPFHDLGHPLLTRAPGQPTYTAIDPFVLSAHGTLYLYWGSDDQPIRVTTLSSDGLRVTGNAKPLVYPVPDSGPYGGLVEGAWVLPHAGTYYLMYSVGDCCSGHANYSVFVSRSRSPEGPFTPNPENPILHANRRFWAVGHNATVKDAAGHDWMVYHARVRGSFTDDRDLMLDRIVWVGGWPVINGGKGPSITPQPVPVVKR